MAARANILPKCSKKSQSMIKHLPCILFRKTKSGVHSDLFFEIYILLGNPLS